MEGGPVKRPTIPDVTERAGVTKGAVSFALNCDDGTSRRPGLRPRRLLALTDGEHVGDFAEELTVLTERGSSAAPADSEAPPADPAAWRARPGGSA